jgi:hypothetical protein
MPHIDGTGGVPNLRVIEDYASLSGPTYWFELHSAIQLNDDAGGAAASTKAQTLQSLLHTDLPGAMDYVLAHGVLDPRVKPEQLKALLRAVYQVAPVAGAHTEGTGGVPNLRVIEDYATGSPVYWFELHTAIQISPKAGMNEGTLTGILMSLLRTSLPAAMAFVLDVGVLDARVDRARLQAQFGALYQVP